MSDIEFEIEQESSSIIKVIGVGGGGGNAVNQMYKLGVHNVDFVICNTDSQALKNSPISRKVQLGKTLTEGLGAGNNPSRGREAAIESLSEIEAILDNNTKMVFITAGMGGGTGTGAAPIIAKAARERNILTIGIVSVPFKVEGPIRINQAIEGIKLLQENVDSILIINNERLHEMYQDLKMSVAFSKADEVLATATKGIAEIITVHGYINVDFEDVRTVMQSSGVAIMGSANASGEDRATNAIKNALNSPLLKDNDIKGAKNILLNIMSSSGENEINMQEFGTITQHVTQIVGSSTNIIWGTGFDDNLNDEIRVTIIATGFPPSDEYYDSVKNFTHIKFGEKIPVIQHKPDEIIEKELASFDEDNDETPRTIEFVVSNPIIEQEIEEIKDIDIEEIDSNADDFEHMKDLNKLNSSEYLDKIENQPAYLRLNKNQNLSFDFDTQEPEK